MLPLCTKVESLMRYSIIENSTALWCGLACSFFVVRDPCTYLIFEACFKHELLFTCWCFSVFQFFLLNFRSHCVYMRAFSSSHVFKSFHFLLCGMLLPILFRYHQDYGNKDKNPPCFCPPVSLREHLKCPSSSLWSYWQGKKALGSMNSAHRFLVFLNLLNV